MKNQITTILLLGVMSCALVAFGSMFGPGFAGIALILALGMNFFGYFYSDRFVLRYNHAREASPVEDPGLHRMVEELATAAGLPKPKVYIIDEHAPNAFATGRNAEHGAVAVTTGLRRMLSERELRGVLAHEMAHIKNRDILLATLAACIASAVMHMASMARFSAMFGSSQQDDDEGGLSMVGTILMSLLAPVAIMMVQMGISRSREYLADATGARLSGDPAALASALQKIHHGAEMETGNFEPATASLFIANPFLGSRGSWMNLLSTHPDMNERIRRLNAMTL